MTEVDRSERIAQTIMNNIAVNFGESGNHEDVRIALLKVLTFYMSLSCPTCRQQIATDLAAAIPFMLAEANRFAASDPDSGDDKPCPTHH